MFYSISIPLFDVYHIGFQLFVFILLIFLKIKSILPVNSFLIFIIIYIGISIPYLLYDFKSYKVIYPNNIKTISRNVLNYLNPQGIAIWYMDDGCLSAKKRNGKIHAYELILNTYISYEDNQIIVDYFKEVWNINFTITRDKGKSRIRCGTREARKFIEIVKPYIVPCMEYKINISQPKKDI